MAKGKDDLYLRVKHSAFISGPDEKSSEVKVLLKVQQNVNTDEELIGLSFGSALMIEECISTLTRALEAFTLPKARRTVTH